ncbi:MAG: DUF1329 domain-containing protein [Alphaproteobacteria bacterium]|nr:DUF1329 domain-containing protein [Alphaproteobacteria bacterium]
MTYKRILFASAFALVFVPVASAKVPAAQADRLGKDLTWNGAETAGSGDVPAYTGGIQSPPAGVKFDPKTQHPPDPFPGDKPKYTITAANMGQYEGKLTEGSKALLKRLPTFKMNVYESRRSCTVPQYVQAATKNNALVAGLTPDGEGVTGGIMGTPFPITENAQEMAWNHRLRFLPHKLYRQYATAPVQANGSFNMIRYQDEAIVNWTDPKMKKAEDLQNIQLMYLQNTVAPPRLAGNVILVHESLNGAVEPRKAWSYNPGQRRTRRAPDIAYDNPGFNTDGMSTADSFTGFNGALDRYTWSMGGKSVKIVPYNSYKVLNSKYSDLIKPNNLNTDLTRYEAHRVWTIEAKLKGGQRHLYARRVMHMDEDQRAMVAAELYDGRGGLWRVQELHSVNFYHVPMCFSIAELVYDVQSSGRYLAGSLVSEEKPFNFDADELSSSRFQPDALRTIGVR